MFYEPVLQDFTEPLFLLFYEAGHVCQWRQMQKEGREELFSSCTGLDRGPQKAAFEAEAWRLGGELFLKFADSCGLGASLAERFERYARQCAGSYA